MGHNILMSERLADTLPILAADLDNYTALKDYVH